MRLRRYVLTGAPGSGKTSILRELNVLGYPVVEEAATMVIHREQRRGVAEPWTQSQFVGEVAALQRAQLAERGPGDVQFFDRSLICTHALATYLGHAPSDALAHELAQLVDRQTYEKHVFFIRNLGFVEPTPARRISYEESLRFEQIHVQSYQSFGYTLVNVPTAPLEERIHIITSRVSELSSAL